MITFLIVTWARAYFAIALLVYIVMTKIDPYDPETDRWDDGDSNKGAAAFWPIFIPLALIFGVAHGISVMFDKVREDITK